MQRAEILQKLELNELRIRFLEDNLKNAIAARQILKQLLEVYDARTSNSQG
jgi:hypothetical protein